MEITIRQSFLRYQDRQRILHHLDSLKVQKLTQRYEKYEGQYSTLGEMINHLYSEVAEAEDAIRGKSKTACLLELADISNCVDILFYMIQKTPAWGQSCHITPDGTTQ